MNVVIHRYARNALMVVCSSIRILHVEDVCQAIIIKPVIILASVFS